MNGMKFEPDATEFELRMHVALNPRKAGARSWRKNRGSEHACTQPDGDDPDRRPALECRPERQRRAHTHQGR